MDRRSGAALFLSFCVAAACARDGDGVVHGAGPTLVPLDSFRIAEADSLYISIPGTPSIDPYDGTIYVADFYAGRVLRFDRAGRVVRVYGRPGSGPGELSGPNLVYALDDSTLLVENAFPNRIEFFDRSTGAFRYGLPQPGFDTGDSPPADCGSGPRAG